MLGLYQDLYRGFTVKHFHEQLVKRHNYSLGYTVTKLHLHREGLVHRAKKRSAHRKKRPRRPMVGMMGSFTQRYVSDMGLGGCSDVSPSHCGEQMHSLNPLAGIVSEHRFQDTVDGHVFLGFSHMAGG